MKIPAIILSLYMALPTPGMAQAVGRDARAMPTTPAPVKNILAARRFTLQTPYVNTWSKERAAVSTGTLVVLEVDPALVVAHDTLEPVLYAGNVAVQRLNQGDRSGRVIGIVPGDIDLSTAPIWFGTPQLPERITPDIAESERALAEKAGMRPFPQSKITAVRRPPAAAKDLAALLRDVAAPLVYQYSAQEKPLADSWRLPDAKAAPKRRAN